MWDEKSKQVNIPISEALLTSSDTRQELAVRTTVHEQSSNRLSLYLPKTEMAYESVIPGSHVRNSKDGE